MAHDITTAKSYAELFSLPATHSVTLTSTRKVEKNSTVYEIRWLEERDQNRKLIARYRTWINHSLKPPYRRQLGWERFSLSGELLDREVRYSERSDREYLH